MFQAVYEEGHQNKRHSQECDACCASAAVSVRQIAISPSMRHTALWQYPSHIEPRSLG